MGDMFSKKSVSTTNQTLNQQVALQGRGQVGISGSNVVGDVIVTSSDPEVILAGLDSVNRGIEAMGRATSENAVIAAGAIDTVGSVSRISIEQAKALGERAFDVSGAALGVANQGLMQSGMQLVKTLDFLEASQMRSLQTVDDAVAAAQGTALMATPQSPAAYAEITGAQSNKAIIAVAGISLLAVVFVVYSQRKKS